MRLTSLIMVPVAVCLVLLFVMVAGGAIAANSGMIEHSELDKQVTGVCSETSIKTSSAIYLQERNRLKTFQESMLVTPDMKLAAQTNVHIALGNWESLVVNCKLIELLDHGI